MAVDIVVTEDGSILGKQLPTVRQNSGNTGSDLEVIPIRAFILELKIDLGRIVDKAEVFGALIIFTADNSLAVRWSKARRL